MSKKYANDENEIKKQEMKEYTEAASGTCFSSEQEAKYRQHKSKLVSKLQNLAGALKKTVLPPQPVTEGESRGKFADLKDRTKWTIYMLLGFLAFISAGNFYCAVLVLIIIMAIYSELLDLSRYKERNNEVKNYYLISWYYNILKNK